jgi:hypothetical protein
MTCATSTLVHVGCSSLALLVARIGAADHVDNATPPHDLAVLADFLD